MLLKKALCILLASALCIFSVGCSTNNEQNTTRQKQQVLSVYMGVVEQAAKVVAAEFEKDTGIRVRFIRMSGGETLEQLRKEKSNPQASIWYGGSADSFIIAKKEGLLEPYKSLNANLIKPEFKGAEGYWTGIYRGYMGFILNQSWFAEKKVPPPASWEDLLRPEFTKQIICSNPVTASTGYVFLSSLVQNMGEQEALAYIARFNKQVKEYTKEGAAPAKCIAKGEAAIGITYLHNGIREMKQGKKLSLSLPKEGTPYEIGAVAIIKNAPEMENAKKFVDWCLTKKAQELGQHNNSFQFPTNPEAAVPEESKQFKNAKLAKYDLIWSGTNRKRLLDAWHRTIRQ